MRIGARIGVGVSAVAAGLVGWMSLAPAPAPQTPAEVHFPGHVGCKHRHGSVWLQSHSRRVPGQRDDDDGEAPRSRLVPFTAVGR